MFDGVISVKQKLQSFYKKFKQIKFSYLEQNKFRLKHGKIVSGLTRQKS
jgi:hypothetical protein